MLMNSSEYLQTIEAVKQEIRTAQYKATVRVNQELLLLYHSIGEVINAHKTWGSKFIENAALRWQCVSYYKIKPMKEQRKNKDG